MTGTRPCVLCLSKTPTANHRRPLPLWTGGCGSSRGRSMPQMMKNLWFLHGFCASTVGADVLSERWAKVQRAFAQVCGNSLGERVCRMCGTIGVNTGRNCPSFWSLLGHSGCHFGVILGSLGLASRALGPKWLASGVLERSLGALGALGDPLGTILGRSWATYGAILGRLGAVRARLGALSWPSWAVLGPSWAVLGLFWGAPGCSRDAPGVHFVP